MKPPTHSSSFPILFAVDLGGTRLRFGRVASSGEWIDGEDQETRAGEGFPRLEAQLAEGLARWRDRSEETGIPLKAAGIAVAGGVDIRRGWVTQTPNLPFPADYPLGPFAESILRVPVRLINDANAFVLGECWVGAAAVLSDVVGLTLGTGIGGGLVANGRLIEGAVGLGGEVGHLIVQPGGRRCGCGARGCLESLAGGRAIAERYVEAREESGHPVPDGEKNAAREIVEFARRGDPIAQRVLGEAAQALGAGLTGLVNLFNPQAVVIGGGLAAAWEELVTPAVDWMKQSAFRRSAEECRILKSLLPPQRAGLLGAVRAADRHAGGKP